MDSIGHYLGRISCLLVSALMSLLSLASPGPNPAAASPDASGKISAAKGAIASEKCEVLPWNAPREGNFTNGQETLTYLLTSDFDGYADLILTGGESDIDLTVTGPGDENRESKRSASEENIFFPVQAGARYLVELKLCDAEGVYEPPFTITPHRVAPRTPLAFDRPETGTVSTTPSYFFLAGPPPGEAARAVDLELKGAGAGGDLELAVYSDGAGVAESLQEGDWERIVLALRPGKTYIAKVFPAEAGAAASFTLAVRRADETQNDGALADGGAIEGVVDEARRFRRHHFRAPSDGLLVQQLDPLGAGGRDIDLSLATSSGKTIYSHDSQGMETVLGNAEAGEDCYTLVALFNEKGASPYRLRNWFVPASPRAEGTPGTAEWFGVFVGIRDYFEGDDLDYCGKDAYDIYREFRELGMPPANARLLIDERATRANIEEALRWLARVAGPEDRVVFFFSGHGVRQSGGASANREADNAQDYISPWNSRSENYDYDLSDDRFAELADAIPARTQVIVIDACYAGGFESELATHPGRAVFLASREDQESGENAKAKGGIMVDVMRNALRALRPEGVPLGRLVDEVRRRVPRICPHCFAAIRPGAQTCPSCETELTGEDAVQEPVVVSTLAPDFLFRLNP